VFRGASAFIFPYCVSQKSRFKGDPCSWEDISIVAAYCYFYGCTGNVFPVHDPWGKMLNKGLTNVETPHEDIFCADFVYQVDLKDIYQ